MFERYWRNTRTLAAKDLADTECVVALEDGTGLSLDKWLGTDEEGQQILRDLKKKEKGKKKANIS